MPPDPSAPLSPAGVAQPNSLLLFHGLASTPLEFGLIRHALRREGLQLDAPELPSYTGLGLEARPRWQDWLVQAEQALVRAAAHGPVLLGGLCTGGMLALALAQCRPELVRGLVLLSPLVAYDGWSLPRHYVFRHLAYLLGLTGLYSMPEREPFGLKNEKMRRRIRQQMDTEGTSDLGPARISLWAVRESERLTAHALRGLPTLQRAVLTLHAREDEICRLSSAQRALRAVPPGLQRFIVLEDSYHMITADNDRAEVVAAIAAFSHAVLPGPDGAVFTPSAPFEPGAFPPLPEAVL